MMVYFVALINTFISINQVTTTIKAFVGAISYDHTNKCIISFKIFISHEIPPNLQRSLPFIWFDFLFPSHLFCLPRSSLPNPHPYLPYRLLHFSSQIDLSWIHYVIPKSKNIKPCRLYRSIPKIVIFLFPIFQ